MKFSVIIPLYNKALYVTKAIESVLAQTYRNFELIVVDDGSADGGYEIVQKFLKQNNSISPLGGCMTFRQVNSGVGVARNNGVAVSKGEYVCFLDADDWWSPTFLAEMADLIIKCPDAGIYGTSYYIVKNGKYKIAPIALNEVFENGYIDYIEIYSRYLCMPLTSISVAIRRSVFDEMKGFKPYLKLGEDFDLWIRIALKYKVAFLNKQLAYYNQDIPAKDRATRNLHKPETHMLFNLGYLDSIEKTNENYKILIDKLRVNGLMPYYLTKKYREQAKVELAKVDWQKQLQSVQRAYSMPIFLLRFHSSFIRCGSCVKRTMIKSKNRL